MPEPMKCDGVAIPWAAAERAYQTYARVYPKSAAQQSLERLNERGGFGIAEFACLYLGHRPGEHNTQRFREECIAKAFMDVGVASDRT